MTATDPYRVDTITDRHGTYEERWMVPPPGDVWFRVTAEVWLTEHDDPECVPGCDACAVHRVRVIHEWKAVE